MCPECGRVADIDDSYFEDHHGLIGDDMRQPSDRRDGELWSFLRGVLSQGKDIHLDHQNAGYEEYAARLDIAALERVEQLKKLLDSP